MKITQIYSHLNGVEFLLVHKPQLWQEIKDSIGAVDASQALTKVSRERGRQGEVIYSPAALNKLFAAQFGKNGWTEKRIAYFVNEDLQTTRAIVHMTEKGQQKQKILAAGFEPYNTYNQVDFTKDRVAIEVQFGKYFSVQYDLHVKHTFFYGRGDIDVGIEIIPMHSLMRRMSSGIAWYENELTNIVREGRSNPSVPVILIGIEP